jgi:hypothetical protein
VEKILWRRTGHRRLYEYNTAHAHCMLDTEGYKDTLRIHNTYCFSTTTMVTRTHLNVVICTLSCSYWCYRPTVVIRALLGRITTSKIAGSNLNAVE